MKIKIARIITRMDIGGAQQTVLYLMRHLDPDLFEQIIITGEGGLLLPELSSVPCLRHYVVSELNRRIGINGLLTDFKAIYKIRAILRSENPDISHTHTPKAGVIGRWASWWAGVPKIVHTFHGFGFGECHPSLKRWFYVLTERLTGMITTQFIAVSETSRLRGQHYGFYLEKNCGLIRSGVDFSSFQVTMPDKSKKKMELGLKPSDRIVGVVAGFKPPKGLHHFLDVARKILDRRPETKFLMVGDGELRTELESQVHRLYLDRAVKMLGWRRDIPDLLQIFDVFLLTSQWEGLPKVLLEAMSLGVPIVATAVDGVGEVVRSGETGYLTSPDNTTEMTERVLDLLENEALRVSMGKRSRLIVEPFSAQKMVQDYSNLYLRVMNQAHHR